MVGCLSQNRGFLLHPVFPRGGGLSHKILCAKSFKNIYQSLFKIFCLLWRFIELLDCTMGVLISYSLKFTNSITLLSAR
uniref:Uncharacterized protein n=1 Tax=Populus trichocarpa TaxID=3694 RepID=A0A2K1XLX0_POPTR